MEATFFVRFRCVQKRRMAVFREMNSGKDSTAACFRQTAARPVRPYGPERALPVRQGSRHALRLSERSVAFAISQKTGIIDNLRVYDESQNG